ncbi:MAG TPA: metallophosphoesterase [Candidatus Krumholzibacteria bacterium]|nr:metallophosphoesterase [Candidatus Krumholzibacteria bacterium]HPD72608.1 metallophosphoesterase [Candidatus Krumholzibacteria bacterium]HRY40460.1 metallophosphoesterase [Candidatus Krumholzibacteria bacterium]
MLRLSAALVILLSVATSCGADGEPPTRLPATPRVVAMGDWHGDLAAARRALRLAGAVDDRDCWIGGDLVVVQTGDVLDRGDHEQAILDLLDRLAVEAAAQGGAVHALLGNHELLNVVGDFRYVSASGWSDFADAGIVVDPSDTALARLPAEQRARAAAFRPGGHYARRLAGRNVAVIIGRDLFVHGGILPEHVAYGLERLNRETRAWLRGDGPAPAILSLKDNPVWARQYSDAPDSSDCAALATVLAALDCDRLFVGHTIQAAGITPACDARVWCLDTGAAAHYGGPVQVLEITADEVTVRW